MMSLRALQSHTMLKLKTFRYIQVTLIISWGLIMLDIQHLDICRNMFSIISILKVSNGRCREVTYQRSNGKSPVPR